MKSFYYLLTLGLLCVGCRQARPHPKLLTNTVAPPPQPPVSYMHCKQEIARIRKDCRTKSIKEKEKAFTEAVSQQLIPAWIGTPWNFYGMTEVPGQGTIACGYFVTTILRDAGIPLNRVKLAQCASATMIRSLVQRRYIQQFSNIPTASFIESIRKTGYGLYIIGLDSHTGLLYHNGHTLYFIHANYTGSRTVVQEEAWQSAVLNSSAYKIVGKISADEQALARWTN